MHAPAAPFPHLPSSGRVGLFDLVRAKGPEAALATASITERAAEQHEGRLEWAGHVDQVFFGAGFGDLGGAPPGHPATPPNEIFMHSYPSRKQAVDALAARREWGLDTLVDRLETAAYRPAGVVSKLGVRALFGVLRMGGRRTPTADLSGPDLLDATVIGHGDPTLRPTESALRAYASSEIEGKVVMLNLLRYRRDASGKADAGRAAYGRYGRVASRLIAGLGGRIRAMGHELRGDGAGPATSWDDVICLEYPSRADFIGMITAPAYLPAVDDRDAGLERSTLLVCTSHAKFF